MTIVAVTEEDHGEHACTRPGAARSRRRPASPRTLVAAHSADDTALQDYVAARARAVFTRRLPPADVVAGLMDCLHL